MPFVNAKFRELIGKEPMGDGYCVTLVKEVFPELKDKHTSSWRAGKNVLQSRTVAPGTAIATFVDGRYPAKNRGNHAAIFYGYAGDSAFWIVDQYRGSKTYTLIGARLLRPPRPNRDGSLPENMSNIPSAFWTIELR